MWVAAFSENASENNDKERNKHNMEKHTDPKINLRSMAECLLSAPPAKADDAFKEFVDVLRLAIAQGLYADAAAALGQAALPTLDYTRLQTLQRCRKQLRSKATGARQSVKLAILGSFTTKQLTDFIDLFLFAAGVEANIFEGEYGVFRQEIFDVQSEMRRFAPQVLFLATTWRDLAHHPNFASDAAEVSRVVEAEYGDWAALWQKAHESLGCQIIQNNFTLPPWRPFANHETRQAGSPTSYIALVNQTFARSAPSFVIIHDVDHLASLAGRWRWDDPRFYHNAKLPCDPECLVDYAHSVASIIAAQLGLAKKCLVLDLDNTLWGGVLGDDGLGGIRLGQGDPAGESFLEFQRYAQSLRRRGVLLAVCSKNQRETAWDAFKNHPEMALRQDDFSCFMANWNDKASNLRAIAQQLNIGLDSLVFIDDNPAERAIVRQLAPEVAVPELPEDVIGYIRTIEQHRYFQVLSVGAEDYQRTAFYQADQGRQHVQSTAVDIETFLRSLEMKARIGPINVTTLERSVQLIHRSNQFNLTARRHSVAEVTRLLEDRAWITLTVSLSDRFGDNGLISVVLAHMSGEAFEIDTWLMSCRVLKRGVEQFVLNHLCSRASKCGLKVVRGEYIPTAKNALVRDHYAGLGFNQAGGDNAGHTYWELPMASQRQPLTTFIEETV
jgi:FkbH-like protein